MIQVIIWTWFLSVWHWFTSDRIVAIATAVYALVTVVMFIEIRSQTKATRSQAELAETTAKAAEENAGAAKRSADALWVGVEALKSTIRARLKINVSDVNPQSQPRGTLNGVTVSLTNYGASTAFVKDCRALLTLNDLADIPADYSKCRQAAYDIPLEAKGSSQSFLNLLDPDPILTDIQVLNIRSGTSFLHFYGFVRQQDIFGKNWTTKIHVRWKMRLNEAARAADASRDTIWQGNCDAADLQLRSNNAPIRNTIPIQYPISNCPAKKRLPSNGFIESAPDHRVQVRSLRGCALPIKH